MRFHIFRGFAKPVYVLMVQCEANSRFIIIEREVESDLFGILHRSHNFAKAAGDVFHFDRFRTAFRRDHADPSLNPRVRRNNRGALD